MPGCERRTRKKRASKKGKPLRDCQSIVQVGQWMQSKGFSPGEHPKFGGVAPVHSNTSLHYKAQALDVNDRDIEDDHMPFDDEHEALSWLYAKILKVAEKHWPDGVLDEMFHDKKGYIKERGFDQNHPIGGHSGHLHVGFQRKVW